MINALDEACHMSLDPPDHSPSPLTSVTHSGRRGRPRIEIDHDLLAVTLPLRGSTHLAPVFGCHPRTVRHRALEHGLAEAGPPVYVEYEDSNGAILRCYNSSTGPQSQLSDSELDDIVFEILKTFPSFGRRMLDGHIRHLGHRVPRARLQESYNRVHGPSTVTFGSRRIQRRVYSVPGPNSLCHHDGQHGKLLLDPCAPIVTRPYAQV